MQEQLHSFTNNPVNLTQKRSTMDFDPKVRTSFDQGQLDIIDVIEVLPGDTFSFDMNALIRMAAQPLKPVLDDCYFDAFAVFCPNRILWKHWEEHEGANKDDYWTQSTEWIEPQINLSLASVAKGSVLDKLGIPTGVTYEDTYITALPLAGYVKIWNEWFRDVNYQAPCTFDKLVYESGNNAFFDATDSGDTGLWYYNGTPHVGDDQSLGMAQVPLLRVNRYHDYFSSLLPSPARVAGGSVTLPLGDSAPLFVENETDNYNIGKAFMFQLNANNSGTMAYNTTSQSGGKKVVSTNIKVDLSQATAATINDLRYAFALQRQFEKDARAGSGRYIEILKSNWGVSPNDQTLQRPEIVGAIHQRIGMKAVTQNNVAQNSAATVNNATGALGATSATGIGEHMVTKSFTEHGYLYILGAVRVKHSYSQGINRMFFKKRRFDRYIGTFANIGETPVLRRELQCVDTEAGQEAVLGFQEAWAEYRYFPTRITGQLRKGSGYADYQAWTYGDEYQEDHPVTISSEWLTEGRETIGNVTALGSNFADEGLQFIADFEFKGTVTREMPVYSIPGLIDHN